MYDERSGQLVTQQLVDWADRVFVMDEMSDKHLSRLCFGFDIGKKIIILLGIKDIYRRGDEALISILKEKLRGFMVEV